MIDAALRKGAIPQELAAQAESARMWPGVRKLKSALDKTVKEKWVRWPQSAGPDPDPDRCKSPELT